MSSEMVIDVNGLGKAYQMYSQPHDRLKQFLVPRFRKALGLGGKNYYRDFWALKDISFTIERGTTMGIIGRNGSGKSTLLQIVCGTLNPTKGASTVHGRVAALLELGSGFNPEFTGRQNVYMNASILGLKQSEIDARFERIAGFADIGDFIDQPVKTYSSGMMVRLAFAVIAHVDADILIIDEALAVGDAVFTQKCMRWLRNFQKTGTVLFVSHDTSSILSLCDKAMWLHEGRCMQIGKAKEVAESYLRHTQEAVAAEGIVFEEIHGESQKPEAAAGVDTATKVQIFDNLKDSSGWKTDHAELLSVSLASFAEGKKSVFSGGEEIQVEILAKAHKSLNSPILGWFLKDRLGQSLFGEHTLTYQDPIPVAPGDVLKAVFRFTLPLLPNGDYSITASIADGDLSDHVQHHWLHDCVLVRVESEKLRYGLVGIQFHSVEFGKIDP